MNEPMDQVLEQLRVPPGGRIRLGKEFDPGYTGEFRSKKDAAEILDRDIKTLGDLQYKLYAQDTYALLLILQGLDGAGKDSTIRHVMSGVNPQGVQVTSFKVPSEEELDHDYLWRDARALPRRGNIGIFNRSYYEEVLVVRVHGEHLDREQLPPRLKDEAIWKRRFEQINNFERYLVENGIVVLKCLLNVSKAEQKKRFLERIEEPEKSWKFSSSDVRERQYWDRYQEAFDDMLGSTSTTWAPWYVIPADHKWFTRLAVVSLLLRTLEGLDLHYPEITPGEKAELLAAKKELEGEE
ncbi:MAG TPA: polyphosphate kinase 2 family protein [Methanomicrobiales archaeon]|nr:polyphosphate kinase 2 family protein [Methanomicrobiales archaeon]